MKNSSRIFGVLLPTLLMGFNPLSTRAQSVSISPLVVEAESHRGQSSTTITITNTDTETFRAKLYPLDFGYDKDGGFKIVPSHAQSAIPYIQLSQREIEIPAGSTRKVRVDVTMPPSVPDGEYRAIVYVEDLKERTVVDAKGAETLVKIRVGSQIFVRKIDGQAAIVPQLKVSGVAWNAPTQNLQFTFQNQGGGTANISTNWQLKQSNKSIANGRIDGTVVLGNSERLGGINLADVTPAGLSPGEYQVSGKITYRVRADRLEEIPFDLKLNVPDPRTAKQEPPTPTPAPAPNPPSSGVKQDGTAPKPNPNPKPNTTAIPGITEVTPIPGITE
jgi:hypothetical protein